jgi:transcriptional regulator with XRE-family HTH domain
MESRAMGQCMAAVQERIGRRIQELRKEQGYSQEKLALLADLDRTYINSVENGRRNISINSLSRIASALNSSLNDFFNCDYFKNKD